MSRHNPHSQRLRPPFQPYFTRKRLENHLLSAGGFSKKSRGRPARFRHPQTLKKDQENVPWLLRVTQCPSPLSCGIQRQKVYNK